MLAGGEHGANLLGVCVIRARHVDDVDRRIGEERLEALVDARQVGRPGSRLRALRRRPDDTDHVDPDPSERLHVRHADEPDAHDGRVDLGERHRGHSALVTAA